MEMPKYILSILKSNMRVMSCGITHSMQSQMACSLGSGFNSREVRVIYNEGLDLFTVETD